MDYILEQVKEKGIVSIIKQYKEDFECYETYQECMEDINSMRYYSKNNKSVLNYVDSNNNNNIINYTFLRVGNVSNFCDGKRLLQIKKVKLDEDLSKIAVGDIYILEDITDYIRDQDYFLKRIEIIDA